MSRILLDLNNPIFQKDLFALSKSEAIGEHLTYAMSINTYGDKRK